MKVLQENYGVTSKGEKVSSYKLINDNGMTVKLLDFGAVIESILVPDSKGNVEDVVLGHDGIKGYENDSPGFGAFVGRHANRIADAKFTLNGKTYELEKNNGENNLHGGSKGYNKFIYESEFYKEDGSVAVEFSRLSEDMEQGFPGNLDITVTYTLTNENELVIEYLAVPDKDTIVNLTNHSYFNLAGHKSGNVLNQKMTICADSFTPTRKDLIPTGEIISVENTPMDFRTPKLIGKDINSDYEAIKIAGGYDHNYVLDTSSDEIIKAAELLDEESGRKLEVFTDLPGIQIYTANMLNESTNTKDGALYASYSGVCFETQFFPNSCNESNFKPCITNAGQEYDYATIFKFSW